MSRPTTSDRNVVIIAVSDDDRNTFAGSLIYRLGLDLPLVERLQKAGKSQYADIVPFMRAANVDRTFYLPHHSCALVDDPQAADVLICIVNATMSRADAVSLMLREDAVKAAEKSAKIVVLLDRMQDVQWDPQKYHSLVSDIRTAFEDGYKNTPNLRFVPISSTGGDNFLELSENSSWYANGAPSSGQSNDPVTVVEAIDA